jgi:signal peptide peptidase SppA
VNYKTGSEIFKSLWLIEPQSALGYLEMWDQFRKSGERWNPKNEESKETVDPRKKFFASQNVIYAPADAMSREAQEFKGFDGAEIAVIKLDGPLMKNDFCGFYGTASLLSFLRLAEQTASVKKIVLLIDSPGGSVDGTANFAEAIKASEKSTVAIITGMMCSAAYWIGSSCDEVIATSKTDITGSIGTKIQWYDRTKNMEKNGIILREYTATKSADKNRAFNEANKGDGKLLVQTLLDPLNDIFLNDVQTNREGKIDLKQEDVLTGKTYLAQQAIKVGLIDRIMPLDKAMTYAMASAKALGENAIKQEEQKQILQQQIKNNNMKWTKILSFLGIASVASAADVKLEDKQLDNMEALVAERDSLKTCNDALITEKTTLETDLQNAKAAQKKAEDDLVVANASIANLNAEVKKLGKQDSDRITTPVTTKDTDSQKEFETSYDREFAELQAAYK